MTLKLIWCEPDYSTAYISWPFVSFLDHSRNYSDVLLWAQIINECSRMLQDHSCRRKLTTKGVKFLTAGSISSARLEIHI